jgi:hypothetical protein
MAIANIDQFLNKGLTYNGARPSRFMCQLTLPNIPTITATTGLDKFRYTCKAASIPSSTIGVVNVGYMGRILKYSGDRTWDEWEISVLLDQDYATRTMFEQWSNGINQLAGNAMTTGGNPANYTGYKSFMNIFHLGMDDNDNDPIAEYLLLGAWPTSIGPIQLAWNNQNAISEFSVRFAYDNCVPVIQNPITPVPVFETVETNGVNDTITVKNL